MNRAKITADHKKNAVIGGELSIGDIFAEEEALRLNQARSEIEAEDAAWNALPPEEREKITSAREERLAGFSEDLDDDDDDEEEDEE